MEKFPGHLLTEIKKRASLCMQKPAVYCRAVLEHANQKANRNEYEQPLEKLHPSKEVSEKIHIPLESREFLDGLTEWAPFGLTVKHDIALAILKKHMEIRKW